MSYNWTTGEKITAPKLNSTGNVMVVHADDATLTLDKTWQEIYDASRIGLVVIITEGDIGVDTNIVRGCFVDSNSEMPYQVNAGFTFSTDSAEGYPAASMAIEPGTLNPPIGEVPIG